ncbi:MAG: hypothetical protein A3G13_01865 [Candidatus Levybacteria bacterium RIFCSPLOWO2_12_FULL_37_7]|nr:MAG: hypothetical protein A3G13_01865 [Candidatus Levybacteria bacterium RIFCSPLOWO2_12_FULL_37_7]
MVVFIWSFVISIIAFLIHFIVWKIKIPKRQTRALISIFFLVLVVFIIGILVVQGFNIHCSFLPGTLPQYLHISLFVISIMLAYIITYSALEADSPSLVMVMEIHKAGQYGLPVESFKQAMTDEVLVIPRVSDLVRDKLIYLEEKKCVLTGKGKLFANIFIFYRHLLNLNKGG